MVIHFTFDADSKYYSKSKGSVHNQAFLSDTFKYLNGVYQSEGYLYVHDIAKSFDVSIKEEELNPYIGGQRWTVKNDGNLSFSVKETGSKQWECTVQPEGEQKG